MATIQKVFARANSAVFEVIEDGSGADVTLDRAFFATGFPNRPSGLIAAFTTKATAAAAAAMLQNLEWSVVQSNGGPVAVLVFTKTSTLGVPSVLIGIPVAGGAQWTIKIKTPNSLTL
jgi:hypothetical protein